MYCVWCLCNAISSYEGLQHDFLLCGFLMIIHLYSVTWVLLMYWMNWGLMSNIKVGLLFNISNKRWVWKHDLSQVPIITAHFIIYTVHHSTAAVSVNCLHVLSLLIAALTFWRYVIGQFHLVDVLLITELKRCSGCRHCTPVSENLEIFVLDCLASCRIPHFSLSEHL